MLKNSNKAKQLNVTISKGGMATNRSDYFSSI